MVSLSDIKGAEQVIGVEYTDAERAQMVDTLEGMIGLARARRGLPLPNSAPSASRFDPRLPSTRMPPAEGRVKFAIPETSAPPSAADDIAFATRVSAFRLDRRRAR